MSIRRFLPHGYGRPMALALAVVLLVAACGGSEPSATDRAPSAGAANADATQTDAPTTPSSPSAAPAEGGSSGASQTAPDADPPATAATGAETGEAAPSSDAPTTSAPAAPAPEPTPLPASELPSVTVVNVATGADTDLADLAPADRPLVLWFWAPH
ncbi:hypothetical protein [Candidatus Poriferisocius sp.]|uniref:hypothetical protein n=1 Tax=Candidatus Poriferisocius sp. TaxID=3101276 RepID=UPI003B5A1892